MGRYKINHKPEFEIAGIIFIGISLLVLLSLLHPSAGFLGGLINMALMRLAGEGRYIFPVLLAGVGHKMFTLRKKSKRNVNLYGTGIIALVLLTALHTYIPENYILQAGWQGEGGGLLGGVTYYLLVKSFGRAGLYIVLGTLFIVGLLLSTNQSLINLLKNFFMDLINAVKKIIRLVDEFLFIKSEEEKYIYEGESIYTEVTSTQNAPEGVDTKDCLASADKEAAAAQDTDSLQYISDRSAAENIEITAQGGKKYFLPPVSLLTKPAKSKRNTDHKDINENIKVLEETLANFGIRVKVTQVAKGPVITRYEVQPPPGIKVSRIVSLADDIALNMASSNVRIEAPVPGKAVVGIEIPNKEISTVYLRELVESPEYRSSTSQLSIALGKDIAGQPVVDDLARMPHLLIAGATGAGKSVCLNTIIAGFLFKATPEQVKIMIIDPKMVELTAFNGIPHLVSPVIIGPKKAATSLRWAVKEMEFRYDLFAACGVRDLERYNKLMLQQRKGTLPLLVIIIDELADLMMTSPGDVEDAVCRLAQMARAAGIHLIIATQRPSVDIITGLIKANIPSRISFAVSSQIDSRTILDMGGAEKLLGRGDMLFYPVGANKPVRVQGAFLSDREVELLVRHWNQQAEPEYDPTIGDELKEAAKAAENMDDMLPEAVKVFVNTGHASISLLQRRLHIGYSRAARIVDIMEKKGYISGYEGSKPRAVLITEAEYKDKFNEAQ